MYPSEGDTTKMNNKERYFLASYALEPCDN